MKTLFDWKKIVTAILGGERIVEDDESEYAELVQRLITENDEEIAQLTSSLNLAPTLKRLGSETRSNRDDMLTSTAFTKAMRRIKDILITRKRREDNLITRGNPASEPTLATDQFISPSQWTGASTPMERVASVKTLIPVAQSAIEQLIISLESKRHNGGPPLDECRDAIESLRGLHVALGQLLTAVDEGRLDEVYNEGLVAEAVRYGKRTAQALRNDPLPYAMAGTILAIMCACGFPTAGALLADLAFSIRRPSVPR